MLFKFLLLSQLGLVSFSADPNVFNCGYQVVYDMYEGKEPVVLSALTDGLFKCNGKMPCGDTKNQYEYKPSERPIRVIYHSSLDGESDCIRKAKNSCAIVRKGIIKKKVVTASFEGRALKEFTCKEGEKVQERILPIVESKQEPVAAPAAKADSSGAR